MSDNDEEVLFTMAISYDRQTLDNPNPIARFAHRVRFSYAKTLAVSFMNEGSALLDYGCGEGRFLSEVHLELNRRGITCSLYGYDPYMEPKYGGYISISNSDSIADSSLNVVTCLEVLEHLDNTETKEFINVVKRTLMNGGVLIVSVPIMMGFALPLKELNRVLLHRRLPDISFRDLLLSTLFGRIPPRAENIKVSHRGYDWRVTKSNLEREFFLERVDFLPFRFLRWNGNSQVLMIFRKNR